VKEIIESLFNAGSGRVIVREQYSLRGEARVKELEGSDGALKNIHVKVDKGESLVGDRGGGGRKNALIDVYIGIGGKPYFYVASR